MIFSHDASAQSIAVIVGEPGYETQLLENVNCLQSCSRIELV